jgi:hypothetical protein
VAGTVPVRMFVQEEQCSMFLPVEEEEVEVVM